MNENVTVETGTFRCSQRVIWAGVKRDYAYLQDVPATVVHLTAKRVCIEVPTQWDVTVHRWVRPESLRLAPHQPSTAGEAARVIQCLLTGIKRT